MNAQLRILIASPLEEEHVATIRDAGGARVDVIHEPGLLPVPRYAADHHGVPRTLSPAELERWRGHLARADVLFDFDWYEPERMPDNCPRLRWVQATSAGIGEYLLSTGLAASSITFTTAAGVHGVPLSEFVVLGLLYLVKGVPWLRARQAEHAWERYTTAQLAGCRVLEIGLGNVGRRVSTALAGLGVEVVGMDPSLADPPDGVTAIVPRTALREALATVDALVLSCPYTRETHHLIGGDELRSMRRGSYLVNIARGPVIDEPELVAALRDGHLGGAVLDVFEREPLPADSPLWDMPNVLVSPHSASTVSAENARITALFVDNLERYLSGVPLRNLFVAARAY